MLPCSILPCGMLLCGLSFAKSLPCCIQQSLNVVAQPEVEILQTVRREDDNLVAKGFPQGQPPSQVRSQRPAPLHRLPNLRLPPLLQRPLPARAADQQIRRTRYGRTHQQGRPRVITHHPFYNQYHGRPYLLLRPFVFRLPGLLLQALCGCMRPYFLLPLHLRMYCCQNKMCPRCCKYVRDKPLHPVSCLGQLVQNLLKNEGEDYQRLQRRKERSRAHLKSREVKGLKVGLKVDIRDCNNIWCEGIITRVISRVDQPQRLLRVNYINYLEKIEEDLPVGSERLAALGFFTGRQDIPHYPHKQLSPLITNYQP